LDKDFKHTRKRRARYCANVRMVMYEQPGINTVLYAMKPGKAPGYANIHREFILKNLGTEARLWLVKFLQGYWSPILKPRYGAKQQLSQ
jgi:hypothetical protein